MHDRVKFYSASDYSSGFHLIRIKEIVDQFNSNKVDYDVNEIIEFYNIIKFIDIKAYLITWKEQDIEIIQKVCEEYKRIVACYIKGIDDSNFIELYNKVDRIYKDDFFELLEKYKVYERVSETTFDELLHNEKVCMHYILRNKKLVNYYGNIIRISLLNNSKYAELLLDKYEIEHLNQRNTIYFPEVFTLEDKETLILNYIKAPFANLNYLGIINNIQSSNELKISDRTRLESKKRTNEENQKFFDGNSGMKYGVEVSFAENQEEPIIEQEDKGIIKCSYSMKWIKDNLDYNTLLNNFIYLFNFVDLQMRITLFSKKTELGLFESTLFTRSKHAYNTGIGFNIKKMLSDLQMVSYYQRLEGLNIRLEEVIEWFFKEYLLDEFKIKNYKMNPPSVSSKYLEKCRTILPELESIIKQYNLYIEDGYINHELLQMSSNPIPYKDIKSKLEKKYIYPNYKSQEFNNIDYYFFSDQCMLSYRKDADDKYNSFYELLLNENICPTDYADYNKQDIAYLLEKNYIHIDHHGFIKISNNKLITILKDLHENEVVNYWKYPILYRSEIDKLLDKKIVEAESSLLSRPEQDYFNYYLNKSAFNNSLDLRNMYVHGTQFNDSDDENVHYTNYITFLKLFILIIIKINDDLCTYNNLQSNNRS